MLENIAMWGGIAGCALALIAIIIMISIKSSVKNTLYRDTILFGENFNIKKDAVCSALSLVDEIAAKGNAIKNTAEFNQSAKRCYNDLLCVLSDIRIAEEFYEIALELNTEFNLARIAQIKLMLRDDLGLSIKHAKIVSRVLNQRQPVQSAQVQQPRPVQPVQQNIQPQQTNPMPRPVQPTQTQQVVRRVVRPNPDQQN